VERIRSKEDRRVVTVKLTSKGESTFRSIFRKHAERVTELASVLSDKEQIQLSTLLKKLGLSLKEKQ
jgi:DNA-binding MarR family transcriptional regulator